MDKTAAILGSVSLAAINTASVPFLGVPLTVVTVAALGSFVSFAWGEPVQDKKKMYLYALASTFIAATFVAVVPSMMGWAWAKPALLAPFAGLLAAMMRFAVPPFIEALPEVIRKVFRLDTKKEEEKPNEK